MIGKIKASGAKLLLAGMQASPNWGEEYKKNSTAFIRSLRGRTDVALYPFFLEGVAMKPDLNQPDGLHPNARGVAIIVERIAPDIAELLGDGHERPLRRRLRCGRSRDPAPHRSAAAVPEGQRAALGVLYVSEPAAPVLPQLVRALSEATGTTAWVGGVGLGVCAAGSESP